MRRLPRDGKSRRRTFARRATVALLCALALGVPAAAAQASQPAQGQYRLHVPSSGASQGGGSTAPDTGSSSSDSNAALIVLLAGAAAIGGAGALVVWRRRQAGPGDVT